MADGHRQRDARFVLRRRPRPDRSSSASRLAATLLDAGARIIDIGGESGVTNRPAVDPAEEIARVVPVIERVSGELGAIVSVDTYKPEVARAAIAAGASIVNDVSAGCATRRWQTSAPRPAQRSC